MAKLIVKLMGPENAPDDDTRKTFRLFSDVSAVQFERKDVDAAYALIQARMEEANAKYPQSTAKPAKWFELGAPSVSDFDALDRPPLNWVVDQMIREKSTNLLYARYGVGKTYLAMEMAYAVATGEDFIGRKVPKPRRVLYVDGEMGIDHLIERAGKLYPTQPENLRYLSAPSFGELVKDEHSAPRIDLSSTAGQKTIDEFITHFGSEFVIFDNISSLVRGIDTNSQDDFKVVKDFGIRLKARGVSVLFIAHENKAGELMGSIDQAGDGGTVLRLEKQKSEVVLAFRKFRDGPEPEPVTLQLTETGDMLIWRVIGDQGQGPAKPTGKVEVLQMVASGIGTQAAIRAKTGISKPWLSEMVAALSVEGLLAKAGKGVSQTLVITPKGLEYLGKVEELGAKL